MPDTPLAAGISGGFFWLFCWAGCAAETTEKTTMTDIRQRDGQTIGVLAWIAPGASELPLMTFSW